MSAARKEKTSETLFYLADKTSEAGQKPCLLYQPIRLLRWISPKLFLIVSNETVPCPLCGHELAYRDSVERIGLSFDRDRRIYIIRRMQCTNPSCHRLHRELPDFLTPFRHYESIIVEEGADGTVCADDPEVGCYPCEKTFHRWQAWLKETEPQIKGLLNAIIKGNGSFIPELKKAADSLLEHFRKLDSGWLAAISRCFCNSGHFLPRNPAPALSGVTVENGLPSPHEEDFQYESASCTKLAGRGGAEKVPDNLPAAGRDTGSGQKDGDP